MPGTARWFEQQESTIREGANNLLSDTLGEIQGITGQIEGELNDISNILARFNDKMPHYRHSHAARNKWEPVYLNQFDVIITPPDSILRGLNNADIIAEQVKNVSGLPEIIPTETVEQNYLWAKRTFSAPVPADTTAELEIEFEVNLDGRNSMYTYEILRAWSELSFHYGIGMHGPKRGYVGAMTVLVSNKARRVFRKFDFKNVYVFTPFNQMELDYLSDGIYVLQVKFKADGWKEERNGMVFPQKEENK